MAQAILPRFWSEKPTLWFLKVEALFAINNIKTDTGKYFHIISVLEPKYISLIEDIIMVCNKSDFHMKYEYVKRELIIRQSISNLKLEEIGTKKPSEYYEYLQKKAESLVPEETIKEIWLKGLPSNVKDVVSVVWLENIKSLTNVADQVYNTLSPFSQESCEVKLPVDILIKFLEKLSSQLNSLQNQLKKLRVSFENTKTKCMNCDIADDELEEIRCAEESGKPIASCWYHLNFGAQATKCVSPCGYKK